MLAQLFAVMAPVLLAAGIGHVWARSGHDYPTEFVTRLVLNIGTPCLVLTTLSRAEHDPAAFSQMALAVLLVTLGMGLLGLLFSRLSGLDWRALVPAFLFPNVGNMGLPVSLYAFGEQGLAFAVAIFLVLSVGHFSVGLFLSGAERSARRLWANPIMLSLLLAVPMLMFQWQLPLWLANSLNLLAGLTIPLMLLTLGVALASIRPQHLGRGFVLGGLRLLAGTTLGWLIGSWLELPPLAHGVLVVQSAMPVAVFNYLFALKANRAPQEVASLVFCSTLLAFVWLPVLLWWWLPALQ